MVFLGMLLLHYYVATTERRYKQGSHEAKLRRWEKRQYVGVLTSLEYSLNTSKGPRPFDSWGGGAMVFFVKKKIVQQILENK